jgi:hypothetical protein
MPPLRGLLLLRRVQLTLSHPEFEGFEVIQTIETTHPPA